MFKSPSGGIAKGVRLSLPVRGAQSMKPWVKTGVLPGRFGVVAAGGNAQRRHAFRAGALARASAPASDLCYNGGRYEESISSP